MTYRVMSTMTFRIMCPGCSGDLAQPRGLDVVIATCANCHADWMIDVSIAPVSRPAADPMTANAPHPLVAAIAAIDAERLHTHRAPSGAFVRIGSTAA